MVSPPVSPMARLIEKGLMFGGLVRVESPVLVERYRRALKHLTGRDTALEDFHLDISGFSPEVGDELGDPAYLNHPGGNRRFILLDLDQKEAPLLNAEFSTSRGILRQFIEGNEAQLFALTARDAVAGELVNSHYGGTGLRALLEARRVTVEADTTEGTVATAERLESLINRFKSEPDAWWDDTLIGEMVSLAQKTGDLSRNPVALKAMSFEQGNFWTGRLGGLYAFRDVPKPAVLAWEDVAGEAGGPDAGGDLPLPVIPLSERTAVAQFLYENGLAEPIVDARGPEVAAILRQKMDFIVADAAGSAGLLREGMTRRDLRRLSREMAGRLPPEWEGLARLVAWAEDGAPWPRVTSEHPSYFYTLRAKRRPDGDLVNRLLAELTPLDVRQLFICHKEAFYRLYRTWPEAKQAYVADMLAAEYMVDKAGTRLALFGPEPSMDEPTAPATPGPWSRPAPAVSPGASPEASPEPPGSSSAPWPGDLIDRVGPWGAVRRR